MTAADATCGGVDTSDGPRPQGTNMQRIHRQHAARRLYKHAETRAETHGETHAATHAVFRAFHHALLAGGVTLVACVGAAQAQVKPVRVVPARPLVPAGTIQATVVPATVVPAQSIEELGFDGEAAPAANPAVPMIGPDGQPMPPDATMAGQPGATPPFTPEALAELRLVHDALEEPEQIAMRAYYTDLGVDLDALFGLSMAKSQQESRGQMVAMMMREMDFTRAPAAVLAARATLGFGQVPHPNAETAQPMEIARWLQLHVMAGEWKAFSDYLASRPAKEAEPIYTAIMQAMNRGDTGLLPEEVLAIADAAPEPLKPWQIAAFGNMLGQSAKKYSTGAAMELLRSGTRTFGRDDETRRRRTIDLLAAAGLVDEAYEFLPSLDEARASADGALLIVHARYKLDLAKKAGETPEGEMLTLEAFGLLAEASLLGESSIEIRRDALKRAIALLNVVPRPQVSPWLAQVFANPALGPAALEAMALTASMLGDRNLEVEQRAKEILGLKESVDILLARDDVDSAALRVPLRMLTTALVAEMEQAVTEKGMQRFIARESQILLRAIPSEKWLRALEPSLATRARRASIALATVSDETDLALSLLDAAIAASPLEAAAFGDDFLAKWALRLQPESEYSPEMMMFFSFYRDAMPMAPLTRGRQRRNLDRLDALVQTLAKAGVEARSLPSIVPAFKACHARTEVYGRDDIVRVFGEPRAMPVQTAAGLAMTMGASLNGDWRNRQVQKSVGTKRTDGEIAMLVEEGYALALELMESAVAQMPESWNLAILDAALSYDRLRFKQSLETMQDPVKQNEYRKEAFEAFGRAAARYVASLNAGETRDDPGVYRRWFGAAMGTAELNFLRSDDLPQEGTVQDDQIDLIRKSMETLETEARDRHVAALAADIEDAVTRAEPEIKQRLVRHALRVIGDHPAGASLRAMAELYRDLVKDEIKLRLALDGSDRVGVGEPFGALLSLRFTHSVDRETGGFSKYLQNGVFARVGNNFRQVNYRDDLQKAIERSLGKNFDVEAIGFFDAFMPPRGVVEGGEPGWLEKPLAYLVLARNDAAVDRVPLVAMDMQFTDQTGPVTLEIPSNTPLLSPGTDRVTRPVGELSISQLVDVRAVGDAPGSAVPAGTSAPANAVTLEVRMRGQGVVPELREALAGLDDALAGYRIADDGIVAEPPIVMAGGDSAQSMRAMMMGTSPDAPKDGYPEPDADGMYRLPIERAFKVTYVRDGGAVGGAFKLPVVATGVEAKLESRMYSDLDIVPVEGTSVPVVLPFWTPFRAVFAALGVAAVAGAAIALRRRRDARPAVAAQPWTPSRITPLGVVTSLRRLESERGAALGDATARNLRDEIVMLELKYFGPNAAEASEPELRAVIEKWSRSAG